MSEREALPEGQEAEEGGYGRDFRLYAAGQAVSLVGDRIALIALVFLVIQLSHSAPAAVALFYVCRILPTLLGGLVAGVLADHFRRQRLMVGCDLGRAVLLLVVPALSTSTLWILYPLVFVLYCFTVLFDTAARAALPDVIPESRMLGANAILQSMETAADFAYAAGGALVFLLKYQAPFYIDAVTFLFSALMVSLMRIPWREIGPLPRLAQVAGTVRRGLAYLFSQPFLKWSTFTFAVAPFAGGVIFVLTPLYANHALAHSPGLFGPLRSGAFRFSLLEVVLGLGALLGSGLAPRLASRWPRGQVFGLGMLGLGLSYALVSLTANLYAAAALIALAGVFNSLFVISGMTLLQTLTPSELRGRVVAARLTIINGALAVGSAAGGVLLGLPYSTLWLLMGGIIAASSLFVWLRPDVRGQA